MDHANNVNTIIDPVLTKNLALNHHVPMDKWLLIQDNAKNAQLTLHLKGL